MQKPVAVLALGRERFFPGLNGVYASHWLGGSSSVQPEAFATQKRHVRRHLVHRKLVAVQEGRDAPIGSSGSP